MTSSLFCLVIFCSVLCYVKGQSYEDARCKCVCTVVNGTQSYKKLYIAPVPPNNDCDGVSVPVMDNQDNKTQTQELCPRCECKYESRNTTIIKVVLHVDGKNLPRVADHHNYSTRHASDYSLPGHYLTLYEKNPSYAGKKLFNLLPAQMKILTGKQLKTTLNDWLTASPFYSLENIYIEARRT